MLLYIMSTFYFFNVSIQIHYLVRGAQKATITIHEDVNKMERVMVNTTLNLCCGGLSEVEEVDRFEAALT